MLMSNVLLDYPLLCVVGHGGSTMGMVRTGVEISPSLSLVESQFTSDIDVGARYKSVDAASKTPIHPPAPSHAPIPVRTGPSIHLSIHPSIHPYTPTFSPTLPQHRRQRHHFRPTRRACFGPDRPSHAVQGLCQRVALPALNTNLNPPLALVDPFPTLDQPTSQLHLSNPQPSPRYLHLLPQTSP